MKNCAVEFVKRGLWFSVFGPIVMGIVFWIIELTGVDLNLSGGQTLIAIVTVSVLAFVQAGSTVFHQIETWSPLKSALLQLLSIYVVYIATYLLNSWIPLRWEVILIFTIVFVVTYFLIWVTVIIVTKSIANKLNSNLK